jgi:DNA polymerase
MPKHLIAARQQVKTAGYTAMDRSSSPTLADQFAAALDWWREAGVDSDFVEQPVNFLADPAPAPTVESPAVAKSQRQEAPAPVLARMGGEATTWPATLAEFATWWLAEPTLDEAPVTARVAPRGAAGAELLVLVPMPEAADAEQLLSGRQGQLVTAMLRAMGIAPEVAYVAAALPRHMPVADWEALREAGLGQVLFHHIALAAPRRILVLGQDVLPLLGLEKRQGVRNLPLAESSLPLLASLAPDILLGSPRSRADLWRRWLDWTGTA